MTRKLPDGALRLAGELIFRANVGAFILSTLLVLFRGWIGWAVLLNFLLWNVPAFIIAGAMLWKVRQPAN